jgi:Uma2 family endonuclease
MSSVPKRLLTPEEYLARERVASYRSEFYRGEIFAMAGGSEQHALIKDNVAGETRGHLKGITCRVMTSDIRVRVSDTGLYTYPDVTVVCGESQYDDEVRDTLLNPRVLMEVLSKSTEQYDRGTKFELYKQIPALQEYILIAQDRPFVESYVRLADGSWEPTEFTELDATLVFASIPVQVPLAEIYRNVRFPADPEG